MFKYSTFQISLPKNFVVAIFMIIQFWHAKQISVGHISIKKFWI